MNDSFCYYNKDSIYTRVFISPALYRQQQSKSLWKLRQTLGYWSRVRDTLKSQVGLISSSSRPLSLQREKVFLPTAESMVGKDKSWPLREQLKKASKNTQQALARSLHLPSLKLTAKESPGGRKFGLPPTCKCAAWGAGGGGEEPHTSTVDGFRGSQHTHLQQPWTLIKGRSLNLGWTWLCRQVSGEKFMAGDLR